MTLKLAFRHWKNGTYPTVEEMRDDKYGQYCVDTGNCQSCYAKLKGIKDAYGFEDCPVAVNLDFMDKCFGRG